MKRIGYTRISRELIATFLTPGSIRAFSVIEGLPEGAILVNAFINVWDDLELHYSHESFPEVQEGASPTYEISVVCKSA